MNHRYLHMADKFRLVIELMFRWHHQCATKRTQTSSNSRYLFVFKGPKQQYLPSILSLGLSFESLLFNKIFFIHRVST